MAVDLEDWPGGCWRISTPGRRRSANHGPDGRPGLCSPGGDRPAARASRGRRHRLQDRLHEPAHPGAAGRQGADLRPDLRHGMSSVAACVSRRRATPTRRSRASWRSGCRGICPRGPLSDEEYNGAIGSVFPVIELHHYVLPRDGPPLAALIASGGMHAGLVLAEQETTCSGRVPMVTELDVTIDDRLVGDDEGAVDDGRPGRDPAVADRPPGRVGLAASARTGDPHRFRPAAVPGETGQPGRRRGPSARDEFGVEID